MANYIKRESLQVDPVLQQFIEEELLPNSMVEPNQFWSDLDDLIHDLTPENKKLLQHRDHLQNQIDEWHRNQTTFHPETYKNFLTNIGYIEQKTNDFNITTNNVDPEISTQAGPQLVVPVNNARYAINAANARWGSLYDAFYGTNAINEENGATKTGTYNPKRGQKVIQKAKAFLDQFFPLKNGTHQDATKYIVQDGQLSVTVENQGTTQLQEPSQAVGYKGKPEDPQSVLLKNNRLHVELQFDRTLPVGKTDESGMKDVVLESAITTIMDCEDSVAAVNAADKVLVYRNLFGLTMGNLSVAFKKGATMMTRSLNGDRVYQSMDGTSFSLPGRSLMLIRNVGHLMTTDAILDRDGNEVPEGMLDAVITGLIGKHDLLGNGRYQNSRSGSIYIVKPKMHGSEEVQFANRMFNRVEDMLGLRRHTMKMGVMDEERRTSLNLRRCMEQVKERIVFINTGFLDRTGDEIHTSMEAGPMIRKGDMKSSNWLTAYEKSNVVSGLSCGLRGKAQIGKGMWAMPDLMNEMLSQKGAQLEAGASTAWVPSPTAATLHALHYHEFDVPSIQESLMGQLDQEELIDRMLEIPVAENTDWSPEEIQQELDNNAQGILGYVVRWVDQGVGCSKVPDINNVALMEDRATLRISSQHMANWLRHGICTEDQVTETMKRMAKVVDEQNADDPNYIAMAEDYTRSIAFQAACALVFQGHEQPNGYTEPLLHQHRRQRADGQRADGDGSYQHTQTLI
ncbi:malate synthase G [Bacillaceae bacterium S4-13-58]